MPVHFKRSIITILRMASFGEYPRLCGAPLGHTLQKTNPEIQSQNDRAWDIFTKFTRGIIHSAWRRSLFNPPISCAPRTPMPIETSGEKEAEYLTRLATDHATRPRFLPQPAGHHLTVHTRPTARIRPRRSNIINLSARTNPTVYNRSQTTPESATLPPDDAASHRPPARVHPATEPILPRHSR